jgi:hypothetical protein
MTLVVNEIIVSYNRAHYVVSSNLGLLFFVFLVFTNPSSEKQLS